MTSAMNVALVVAVAIVVLFVRWAYRAARWRCHWCNQVNQPWADICFHCGFEYRAPTWP